MTLFFDHCSGFASFSLQTQTHKEIRTDKEAKIFSKDPWIGTEGGKEEARPRSVSSANLENTWFRLQISYLIRHTQLLSLNITLKICQPPTAVLQVFVIM